MECHDWRERISAHVDGEVSPAEARLVEEHLEECAECRALERKMRAVGIGMARTEAVVPPDFREKLFARMEAENLLPRRRSLLIFSLRWAAVPLAAAAALALFLLTSTEKGKEAVSPQGQPPLVARRAPVAEPSAPSSPAASPRGQSPATAQRRATPPASAGLPEAAVQSPPALAGRERGQAVATARAEGELTPEDREVIAHLDVLEDPSALDDQGDVDAIEIFAPGGRRRG